MKIISLLWGYSLGGIGKVALTYGRLHELSNIEVFTIIIQLKKKEVDLSSLKKINSKVIYIKNRLDLSWLDKVKNDIIERDSNCLFVHGFNGPIIGLIIKQLYFKKIFLVCSYHGLYHATTSLRKFIEPIFNYTPIIIYKKFANKVITVEGYSKKILETKGVSSDKIEIVYNGLPTTKNTNFINLSKWGLSKNDFIIGCASRIDPVKGLSFLITAFNSLNKKFGNKFKLVIIGEGTCKKDLERQANDLNLSGQIIFTGYQNNINEWLNIFDVFALPSLAEYHSIGLLEAMRAEKTIVATRVGGNPESVRHEKEALLVDSKSSKQIFEAICKIYENKFLATKLAQNAKKRFNNKFSEQASIKNLVKVFKNLS